MNQKTLHFLDILLIINNNILKFKVHHKSINKNSHIHFYLHHKTKIKSGIIIGFCTPKFLNDEFDYIENSFEQLLYPKSFFISVK